MFFLPKVSCPVKSSIAFLVCGINLGLLHMHKSDKYWRGKLSEEEMDAVLMECALNLVLKEGLDNLLAATIHDSMQKWCHSFFVSLSVHFHILLKLQTDH